MSHARYSTTVRTARTQDRPGNVKHEAYVKLAEADDLRLKRSYDKALAVCDALLSKHPNYVGALQTAGLACADKRDNQRALGYLTRAIMLCPDNWAALTALSGVYLQLGARDMAARTLEQAGKLAPDDLNVRSTLAMVCHEQREYERAVQLNREVLAQDGKNAGAGIGLAMSCLELGWYAEAAEALERLLSQGKQSIRVIHLLSKIIPPSILNVDLGALTESAARSTIDAPGEFDMTLAYLRGTVHSRTGNHAEAWHQFEIANRLSLQGREAERKQNSEQQQEAIRHLNSSHTRWAVHPTTDDPVSLFILGPSRSGKTSLERLTGKLSSVKLGYENPAADNALRKTLHLAGLLASSRFWDLPPKLEQVCREHYREEMLRRAEGAKVFTNTDPSRIFDVPRLAAMIPNARFVFIKRDLYDTALRIFMTRYRFGNAYAYDIKSIFEHIRWYYQMIDMVAARYPTISTVVQYEQMIADPATMLKSIASTCGLQVHQIATPDLGDDRDCARPFRKFIESAMDV